MANVNVFYFTGTGNTARAVKRVTDACAQAGHAVNVRQIIRGVPPSESAADMTLIAYPTFSLSAPVMVKRFLRRLPPGQGKPAAVLSCTGGTLRRGVLGTGNPGQGLMQVEGLLRRRGYRVFLTGSIAYPENWTQVFEPPDEKGAAAIIREGDRVLDEFISGFLAGKEERHRVGLLSRVWGRLLAAVYGLVGRRALGKMYIADTNCSACGLCAKSCPAGVLVMRGKRPRWRLNCEDCCRCINICPEKSIQFSAPLLFLHLTVQILFLFWWVPALVGLVMPLFPVTGIPGTLLAVLLFIVGVILFSIGQIVVLDPLMYLLSGWKPIRRFLSLGWTRRYRRYTAPGFKPLRPV